MQGLSSSLLVFVFLLLGGCASSGQGKVKVTGQLLRNDKPLKLKTDVMREMTFYPYEEKKADKLVNTYPAVVNDDGTFEVSMPPGKYVIALKLLDGTGDICKGTFTPEKSKLIRDIAGKAPMNIEVTKPGG